MKIFKQIDSIKSLWERNLALYFTALQPQIKIVEFLEALQEVHHLNSIKDHKNMIELHQEIRINGEFDDISQKIMFFFK